MEKNKINEVRLAIWSTQVSTKSWIDRYFNQERGEPKAKGLPINWNVKNFRYQSHNEILWFKKIKCYEEYEAKWKASKLCNQVMWEVIYAYIYNWDGSHYLVLIVYGWLELIIEASYLTKDYLIVDIHKHHTCQRSMNAIFICVIVLD